MILDEDLLKEPFQKLRKSLKPHSKLALPEEIHCLRTQIRRLEATIYGMRFDRKVSGDHLLKAVKPVRKAAGKVRDMDVFVALVSSLISNSKDEGPIRLLEYLGGCRVKAVSALHAAVEEHRRATRHYLKRCFRQVKKKLDPARNYNTDEVSLSAGVLSFSRELEGKLAAWPNLDSKNLHSYRLKVKELRYILQFTQDRHSSLVKKLGQIKDRIGEWHDWHELSRIARKVLGKDADDKTAKRIRRTARQKLGSALTVTNAMRARYLSEHMSQVVDEK